MTDNFYFDNAILKLLNCFQPCYHWWEVPYYWAGLKAYDLVAGTSNLVWSKYMGATETLSFLPTLSAENPVTGQSLKGSASGISSKDVMLLSYVKHYL